MLTTAHNGQVRTQQTRSIEPIQSEQYDQQNLRRHADRFVNFSLPKTLYQHMARLVGNFLQQIVGREGDTRNRSYAKPSLASNLYDPVNAYGQPREVRGIADRMHRLVDPDNPFPNKDLVLLGEAKDYTAPVIAIEYDEMTKPVFYEGNQVVARYLYLDSTRPEIAGQLVLADGSRLPINIRVITAV